MKTFARTTTFLLSLFFVLFSTTLVCADTLYYLCDENGNKGSDDYQLYVAMIYGTMYTQAAPYGYGYDRIQEVHGSLLCRGDVDPYACEFCYIQASQLLRSACPEMLQAFGNSEYCSLLYTYKDTDKSDQNIYLCYAGNIVPNNLKWFTDVLWQVFLQVALNAANDPKYMSAMYVDLGNSNTLYVYGQCHNEITPDSCRECLDYLRFMLSNDLGDSSSCTYGFVGGKLVAGSCIVRYELYPFIGV